MKKDREYWIRNRDKSLEGDDDAWARCWAPARDYLNWLFRCGWFVPGLDPEDIRQEVAIMVFTRSLKSWDPEKSGWPFFVRLTVYRGMYTLIKAARAQKHAALNEALTEMASPDDCDDQIHIWDEAAGPEETSLDRMVRMEDNEELVRQLRYILTPMEADILDLYLQGCNYREIAVRLDPRRHPRLPKEKRARTKCVDNGLCRIKSKACGVYKFFQWRQD